MFKGGLKSQKLFNPNFITMYLTGPEMILKIFLKRRIFSYLDKYSKTATKAEMFMSWQSVIGIAQREWNMYIPAKDLYLYLREWHKKRGRAHLLNAMDELNRSYQIKVMEDLYSENIDNYRQSKDSSYLEFANDCFRDASKIRRFPKKGLHLYLSNYLGG